MCIAVVREFRGSKANAIFVFNKLYYKFRFLFIYLFFNKVKTLETIKVETNQLYVYLFYEGIITSIYGNSTLKKQRPYNMTSRIIVGTWPGNKLTNVKHAFII